MRVYLSKYGMVAIFEKLNSIFGYIKELKNQNFPYSFNDANEIVKNNYF